MTNDCRGGDYCDDVCPGPGQCAPTLPYDHECNCQPGDGRMVAVPAQGEWLVRDGKVVQIIEAALKDGNSEYWTYEVYIDAPVEDGE